MDEDTPSFLADVAKQVSSVGGASARAGLSIDVTQIRNLNTELSALKQTIKEIKEALPSVVRGINAISAQGTSATGARPGRSGQTNNGVELATKGNYDLADDVAGGGGGGGDGDEPSAGGAAGGGGFRAGLRAAAIKGVATALNNAAPMVAALDRRIDRGAAYALSADRMSMIYQQMTGLSQQQVQNQFRQPLTDYRLGMGGVNTLLGLQAETGLNAQKQASSVEAIRTISGFTLGTNDVSNMLTALAQPQTANRMFMMTGQSLYGFGGQQNTIMDVFKGIASSAGLNDKAVVESAFQPGSVTRDQLRMAGLPEDMITTVLQYARQNIAYKEKGGSGMYDPSIKEHRKLMGIEDNFATQSEETQRVRAKREEQFYSRQADNLADMERATQAVTKALGAFEDKLSGIVGARTSTRPFQRFAGTALKVIAPIAGVAAGVVGTPAAGVAVGTALYAAGSAIEGTGDGSFDKGTGAEEKTNVAEKVNASKKTSTGNYPKTGKYRNLNPKFAARLYAMLQDNKKLRLETGWRSTKTQENLFLSRHERVNEKTDIFWDGSYWKRVRGPAAAPPGRSMHEIGLAADVKGDLEWVKRNAHKYGLKHFADVNNEPWHVQPRELPNSRREYEKRGAPWGTDSSAKKDDDRKPPPTQNVDDDDDDTETTPPRSAPPSAVPPNMPPSNTPGSPTAPSNSGVDLIGAVKPKYSKSNKRSVSNEGLQKIQSYSGLSIQDIMAQMRENLTSSLGTSAYAERIQHGDGSFYSGVSEDSAPVLSVPTGASSKNVVNNMHGGDTINISPVININGNPSDINSADIKKLAKEVGRLLEDEVRLRHTRRH